jgi:hypothetical protein
LIVAQFIYSGSSYYSSVEGFPVPLKGPYDALKLV